MQGPKWPFLLILIVYGPCVAILNCLGQVLYLGRAPRTKETLPNFCEWCRVTRYPRVFRGLTGCQRTPWDWGVTNIAPPPLTPRRRQPHAQESDDNHTCTKATTKS